MTEAQISAILASLKVDLGVKTESYDSRLKEIIKSSYESIVEEGAATLDPSDAKDAQLIIMYSAWTWRRRDEGEKMPLMLRKRLNNRILGEKAR